MSGGAVLVMVGPGFTLGSGSGAGEEVEAVLGKSVGCFGLGEAGGEAIVDGFGLGGSCWWW